MDQERIEDALRRFEEAYITLGGHDTDNEYIQLGNFMQALFVKGDQHLSNLALMNIIYAKVKKHPWIWKLLFTIR